MIDTSMKIIGGGSTPGMSNSNAKPPSAPTVEGSSGGGSSQAPAPAGMGTQVVKTA